MNRTSLSWIVLYWLALGSVLPAAAGVGQSAMKLNWVNDGYEVKTRIRLGEGWEEFGVLYPEGATFQIPVQVQVGGIFNFTDTGLIEFRVGPDLQVTNVNTGHFYNTPYMAVNAIGDSYVFGQNAYPSYYQIGVTGELHGFGGMKVGKSRADGESAEVVENFTFSPPQWYQGAWVITVDIDELCLSCPSNECQPGSVEAKVGSLDLKIALGNSLEGNSTVSIYAQYPHRGLSRPALLTPQLADDAELIFTNYPRQIRTANGLVDVQVVNDFCYELLFYQAENIGSPDSNGFYEPTGSPERTIRIENPDASTTVYNRLKISEIIGAQPRVTLYTYNGTLKQWVLARPGETGSEEMFAIETQTPTGGVVARVSTVLKKNHDGTTVEKTSRSSVRFPWGWETIEEIQDPDGAALQTVYEYYEDAQNAGEYGRLKQKTDPYGHWEKWEYDAAGRETKRISQHLNNDVTSADADNRVVATAYSSTTPHKTVVESLLGQEVSRRYEVYEAEGEDNEFVIRKDIVCTGQGAAWDDPDNLVTVTKTYNPFYGLFKGLTKSIRHPDGTMTLYSYSQEENSRTTIVTEGEPAASGDAIVKGVRTETQTDLSGNQLLLTISDIETSIVLEEAVTSIQDGYGRPERMDYADGTFELFERGCCTLDFYQNREGMVTLFTYDALKRLTSETKAGITTHYSYDGAGRRLSVIREGSDSSEIIQEIVTYDLAGRETSRKDAMNNITTYSESIAGNGNVERTTIWPDESSRTESFYQSGLIREITGDAAYPLKYEYGVAGDGLKFTKEIRIGPDASETEWRKIFKDMVGRDVRIEYPDDSGEFWFYNNQGQLVRQTDADGVAVLYAYNGQGELAEQAIDRNNDGFIDSGDQRKRLEHKVEEGPLLCAITEEGSASGYVLAETIKQSPNGRYRKEIRRGLETEAEVVYDGNGNSTETTTHPDGSVTANTYESGRLVSSQQEKGEGGGAVRSMTCTYDAHGRLAARIDGRVNTMTSYSYNNLDQVTEIDAGGLVTGYTLNALGQVTTEILPGSSRTITRTYLPTGEITSEGGTAAYPASYTYDPQGRRTAMTTSSGTTTWTYSSQRGWLTGKTDAASESVSYTHTPAGRLATRTWARGIATTYGYNGAGELSSISYSDSTPGVTLGHDERGRLTSVTDAAGSRSLTYNTAGQPLSESLGGATPWNGLALHNTYDDLLRRSSSVAKRGGMTLVSADYSYDGASRLAGVSAGAQSAAYSYLANSSLVSQIAFNQGGPAMTTSKSYDSLDRLSSISSTPAAGDPVSYAHQYNSAGQRSHATLADDSYWVYGYNDRGEVTGGGKKLSGGADLAGYQFGYAFDNIGNRTSATDNGRTSAYTANNLNQYENRIVPGYVNVVGEAKTDTTVTVNGQSTTRQGKFYHKELSVNNSSDPVYLTTEVVGTLGGDTANREGKVFVPKTPEAFVYDEDGNLLSDGRWNYTWDGENRLIVQETASNAAAAGAPRVRLTFTYDYQGRRVAKKIERNWSGSTYQDSYTMLFVWDGWNMVAEVLAGGPKVRTYVWGNDLSGTPQGGGGTGGLLFINQYPENKSYSVGYDGNENVTGLFDMGASGTQAAYYEYGPFGEPLTVTGPYAEINPVRWSTKYQDRESGSAYYGFRYYNSETGRWLNRDPLGDEAFFSIYTRKRPFEYAKLRKESLQPTYLFVGNTPVNEIDPTGLDRYITHFAFSASRLHVGVAVDTWKNQGGKWVKDGVKSFNYSVDWQFGGPENQWGFDPGNILLGLVSGRGRIVESNGLDLESPIKIKSNPCQDMKMLIMLRRDAAAPPRYNVFFHNCIVWASKAIAYGLNDKNAENCCNPDGASARAPGRGGVAP